MKLEDIIELWRNDAKIDDLLVDSESANVPKLHAKYVEILVRERSLLRTFKLEKKTLIRILREYYLGNATQEQLEQLKRPQQLQRILKTEISQYIESDPDVLKLESKIEQQEEKVELLLEIMKSINSRGFALKNILEWKKLMLGN